MQSLATNRYFRTAKAVSLKSTDRVKIGAVLVSKHQIVSVGFNKMTKTHPKMSKLSEHKRIHAELDALIGVDASATKGSTVYIYRETRRGGVALSKPCPHCQVLLKEAGVKTVYYSDPAIFGNISGIKL